MSDSLEMAFSELVRYTINIYAWRETNIIIYKAFRINKLANIFKS